LEREKTIPLGSERDWICPPESATRKNSREGAKDGGRIRGTITEVRGGHHHRPEEPGRLKKEGALLGRVVASAKWGDKGRQDQTIGIRKRTGKGDLLLPGVRKEICKR